MPYVFGTSIFPPHTAEQIAKIYVDIRKDLISKLRVTGKEIIPNAIKSTLSINKLELNNYIKIH